MTIKKEGKKKKYFIIHIPWKLQVLIAVIIMVISGTFFALGLLSLEPEEQPPITEYVLIDPKNLTLLAQNNTLIIDLNPLIYRNNSYIPYSINIPIDNNTCMSCWYKDLKKELANRTECIFYDLSGIRSNQALDYCIKQKFSGKIYLLQGGLVRWKAEGYPVVTP